MSAFVIKLIAIFAMAVDHIGYIFFPNLIIFRIIGRLTMPIMAFFASEGVRKTRSKTKYLIRLFIFALLSEIPYRLAFSLSPENIYYPSNVLFTIFFGVLALSLGDLIEKQSHKPLTRLFAYIPCLVAANFFYTDWNWLGVLMIIAFYHAKNNKIKLTLFLGGSYLLYIFEEWLQAFYKGTLVYGLFSPVHLYGLFALIPIFLYNGKRGCNKAWSYLFYFFYPAHLIILYAIKYII